MAARRLTMYLGQCLPSNVEGLAKVTVRTLKRDEILNAFFPENTTLDVRDPQHQCRAGDTVLIEQMPDDALGKVKFQLLKTVYRYGDNRDPITGKLVMGTEYREHVDLEAQLAGKDGGVTFDYESAPPRGWQEGKKDWSHREPEVKWHDDGKWEPHQW
ncbi:28S ribosomal protein S17, mitochondrial-like [Amphibalanus amphitrite]|uniref:28S ribosomal protein S17, mitochondrial-like n=1 Tax=Amphibalanus amphitrite TaxID=1232801 RepID=UPI001C92AA23|nr:28S ribosomal protein S17, mitochondrial-like [Amphibalanus amphitrite]XP_043233514.1 28S ribosomal protein S17, mitochondrial-like [Amphibalanus amphitrite]